MKVLELFCGTKSISKAFEKSGHETFTIDYDQKHKPNLILDIGSNIDTVIEICKNYDVIWMSPPCTTFSMASGNRHWSKDKKPKTEQAYIGKHLLNLSKLIYYLFEKEKIIFIENPVARARWFMEKIPRYTVWYCRYGDKRAKPTDIWSNIKGWQPKTCRPNNPFCNHQKAPRGSKTGTQGIKEAKNRGIIPERLCDEIVRLCEKNKYHDN